MSEQTSNRGGFSLVEIIAAMMILTCGLLAMAASTTFISAQMRSSSFDVQRNLARQQVIEQLRGTFFASVVTNSTGLSVGRYTVRWDVATPNNAVKQVRLYTGGPAYRAGRGARTTVIDTAQIEITSPK
jgi:hypothetical protein